MIAGVFAFSLHGWYSNPAYAKSEYASGVSDIASQARPGDIILLHNTEQKCLFDYYRPQGLPVATLTQDDTFTPDRAAGALANLTKGYQRAWLITYGDLNVFDPNRNTEAWLSSHGYWSDYKSYKGFYLSLYDLGPPTTAPSQPLDVPFGDQIRLKGYDVSPKPAQRGGTMRVTLYWQANATPPANYVITAQLLDTEGKLVAQMDGEPAGRTRPTSTWQAGETIVDLRAIGLDSGLAPATYTLQIALYTWPDLTRLKLGDGSNADVLELTKV